MALKKKSILLIMAFLIGCDLCACGKEDSVVGESLVEDTEEVSSTEETKSAEEEAAEQWEKGYDLPVDEQEREEAETDCKKLMEHYLDIYETADILNENEEIIEFLAYDRLSENEKCELYVWYRSKKNADGSWHISEAEILDIFAYNVSTKDVVSSGKTSWSATGSEEHEIN